MAGGGQYALVCVCVRVCVCLSPAVPCSCLREAPPPSREAFSPGLLYCPVADCCCYAVRVLVYVCGHVRMWLLACLRACSQARSFLCLVAACVGDWSVTR
jgi:hypothetical protein